MVRRLNTFVHIEYDHSCACAHTSIPMTSVRTNIYTCSHTGTRYTHKHTHVRTHTLAHTQVHPLFLIWLTFSLSFSLGLYVFLLNLNIFSVLVFQSFPHFQSSLLSQISSPLLLVGPTPFAFLVLSIFITFHPLCLSPSSLCVYSTSCDSSAYFHLSV